MIKQEKNFMVQKKTKIKNQKTIKRKKLKTKQNLRIKSRGAEPKGEMLFEELLINKIIDSKNHDLKTPSIYKNKYLFSHSILLKNIITNFTNSISDISYKKGIFTGRLLYNEYNKRYNYSEYQNSIWHLVEFLELSGHKHVLFMVFPDKIIIKIYNQKSDLRSKVHAFEAGLISGFISAAKNRLVSAREVRCVNDGSELCEFVYDEYNTLTPEIKDTESAINKFMLSFFSTDKKKINNKKISIPSPSYLYNYLSYSPIYFSEELNSSLRQVFAYLGTKFNQNLFKEFDTINKNNQKKIFSKMGQIMDLFDVGLKVRSAKPVNIQLTFNNLNSKMEFVNLLAIFFNNLSQGYLKVPESIEIKSKNGRYNINIREEQKIKDKK